LELICNKDFGKQAYKDINQAPTKKSFAPKSSNRKFNQGRTQGFSDRKLGFSDHKKGFKKRFR
tara:strand:- start:1257 stop:1445 length:189 start_codon:yes stop_codon:yes gene_type:complete